MDFRTFISNSLKPADEEDKPLAEGPLQTVHLEKALKRLENERPNLKPALSQVLDELTEIQLDRRTIMTEDWSAIDQKTNVLGLEKVNNFINGLIQLKKQPTYLELIDIKQLNRNLKQIVQELAEAVDSLDSFGFFKAEGDGGNLNLLENKHVLIVEDMLYNRVLLKKILQRYDCTTEEAENGQVAIEKWQETPSFDLVIMDMNMPIMDGFEATREIRRLEAEKNLKKMPIIALTALAMRGDREKCIEAGCSDYMTKPVETTALAGICNSVLSGAEQETTTDVQKTIDIQNILLKTENQIYEYIFSSVLRSIGIEFERIDDISEIQKSLAEDRTDFLILDAETDLGLAFYLKNNFPDKQIITITSASHHVSTLGKNTKNNLHFPFSREELLSVLHYYSKMQKLARIKAESIADADSLSKIKGQAGIKEAVEKSNHQLAVWQKAFRKIGGDLVLSHQFNLHGKYGFILGDVSGHDIQSGYTASWFSGLVKGVWGQYSNPHDLLCYLNSFLDDDDEEEKRFVCALVLLWDPLRHKLSFANAGIPGGILVKKETGESTLIKWTGIPVGMLPEMDMFDHEEIDFKPGDRLYIATDGVLEAIPSEVISGIGETQSDEPPQKALESIVDFVTRSIEVTDDLTIAVFEGHELKEPQSGFRRTIQSTNPEIDSTLEQIEGFLKNTVPDAYDMTKVLLAAREALINALDHGNNNVEEKPIDIDVELFDKTLEIRISDSGGGFDLLSEKKKLAQEGDLRIHGRGIQLMESICKSVTYNGSGICMEFEETGSDQQ